MRIARPRRLDEALDALAAAPDGQLLAGGTDFMVEVNFGHRRPESVVALRRVGELRGWERRDGAIAMGAGLTYTDMERDLAGELPALAQAARTVGSPQIRNAGTLGGNLGTASPAGDTLPLLAALDAQIVLVSAQRERVVPLAGFVVGVKHTSLQPGELIREVRVTAVDGPQAFLKVGTRNAMVISVAACALVLDTRQRQVRCGLGSVAPVPVRAPDAEAFAAGEIDWDRGRIDETASQRFGRLVAGAAAPITDHRSTDTYRRRAVEVMARRALRRCLAAW